MTDFTVAIFIALGGAAFVFISFILLKFWFDRHPAVDYKQPRKIMTGVIVIYVVLAGLYVLLLR